MTLSTATILRLFAAMFLVVLVAGCQSTKYAGEGPLRLSAGVTDLYEKYKMKSRPVYFLVTENGECGRFAFCPGSAWACEQKLINFSSSTCCGIPCKVMDKRGGIVWKGPITDANGKLLNP